MRWLFPGTEIRIDTRCLDCGEPLSVCLRGEAILGVDPPSAVGHMNVPFAKALASDVSWGMA